MDILEKLLRYSQAEFFEIRFLPEKYLYLRIHQGLEVTVSYHAVFNTPTFYFRIYAITSDLEGEKLEYLWDADEIINMLHWQGKVLTPEITLDYHPELNEPWVYLHNCNTEEFLQHTDKKFPKLLSWFSVYGALFKLSIPSKKYIVE